MTMVTHHPLANMPIAIAVLGSSDELGHRIPRCSVSFGELSFTKLLQHNDECWMPSLLAGSYLTSHSSFSPNLSELAGILTWPCALSSSRLGMVRNGLLRFNLGTQRMSIPSQLTISTESASSISPTYDLLFSSFLHTSRTIGVHLWNYMPPIHCQRH